jgi:peptidoglycan hydrolase-like protein with peptidoglycan-binding domain
VRDEIVIVDNSHRIVSVVPVGSSGGAQLDNRDRGSVGARSGTAMNLSTEEIREVQQVLVREGFDVEVDGRISPKFHEALISFQRKNGLQPTGEIDTQTVTKLGVNVRSSTTGQGGQQGNQGNMPREQGQQGRQDQQGGDRNNQRSDQDRRDGNAPSNTQGRGDQRSEQDRNNANAPSTTGQGGQQKGGERGNMPKEGQGNMPKSQQDGNQKSAPSNREQQK